MNHITDRIQTWLSGELSEQEALSFQEHLEACPECAAAAAEARTLWEMLGDAVVATPASSPSVWPEVRRRTVARAEEQNWFFGTGRWMRSSLATAAVAAGLLVGILFPGGQDKTVGGEAQASSQDMESQWLSGSSWDSELTGLETAWLATGDESSVGTATGTERTQ